MRSGRVPASSKSYRLRAAATLFSSVVRARDALVAFGFGDGFLLRTIPRRVRIRRGQFQFGDLSFPVFFCGGDLLLARPGFEFGQLRGRLVAAGRQFRGFQFDDNLAGLQRIAFLRENPFDSAAVARGDVDFIGFDRAGNGVGSESDCRRQQHSGARARPRRIEKSIFHGARG